MRLSKLSGRDAQTLNACAFCTRSSEKIAVAGRFVAFGLLELSTLRFFVTIGADRASFSRSEALVGGDDARGDDFVGEVFLLFIEVDVTVPREFWLPSDGRCLSRGPASGCLGLMRFDKGVPELELESSSSRGRFAVICCFTGSLIGGRGLATTISFTLGAGLGAAFGLD
ncbi:hypothetical protein HG531_001816 [Fusarium graminearum]|nr:hypothetical protein HG531_001816 [Fusarium graminearum]